MNKFKNIYFYILSAFLLLAPGSVLSADSVKRGTIAGGVDHEAPDWFKESFLEMRKGSMLCFFSS